MHIELPLDVITAPGDSLLREPRRTRSRPGPDPQAIGRAAEVLRAAKDPFVVLGGGAADAPEAARALVERLGAPTALTINAKGVLPPGHPLNLGSSCLSPRCLIHCRPRTWCSPSEPSSAKPTHCCSTASSSWPGR